MDSLTDKKVWVGEMHSASSLRRLMIGTVDSSPDEMSEGNYRLTYVMIMDLQLAPPKQKGGQPQHVWGMTPDPSLFSGTPSNPVNLSLFLINKILDPVEDKGLVSQYQAMVQEIRTSKAGLVTPKSPIMPGRQ